MMLLLLLINVFTCCATIDATESVLVITSRQLEEYLCHYDASNYDALILCSSSYNISHGNFCEIRRNIVIRSASNETVLVTCQAKDSLLQGFLFSGCSVTIENLHFKNCGTYLRTIKNHKINASHLYYNTDHAAALVVIDSRLVLTNVTFTSSFGFSIIGINLKDSTMNGVTVNNTNAVSIFYNRGERVGAGIVVHFIHTDDHDTYKVVLNNCFFSHNFQLSNESACIGEIYYKVSSIDNLSLQHHPLINGVGLTIVYTHSNAHAAVIIDGAHFIENAGHSTGALVIVQFDDNSTAQTTISNTEFHGNMNLLPKCHGAALGYYMFTGSHGQDLDRHSRYEPLTIFNTRFIKQKEILGHGPNSANTTGAICLAISNPTYSDINIVFRNCTWIQNLVHTTGACLYAYVFKNVGNVCIYLDNTTASDNSQTLLSEDPELSSSGMFSFDGISRVYINGISNFCNNYGSVIVAVDSNVYLFDSVSFTDNVGLRGPAITILKHSLLYFMDGLEAVFKNNTAAYKGGAIYAETFSQRADIHEMCALQLEDNVTLNFTDNDAKKSGKSIYAAPIFSCKNDTIIHSAFIANSSKVTFSSSHSTSDTLLEFSTQATVLQDCNRNNWSTDVITFYPGQTYQMNLTASNEYMSHVYSPLSIDVHSDVPKQMCIPQSRQTEFILAEGKCTVIAFGIHSATEGATGEVILSIPNSPYNIRKCKLKAMKCPLGFKFKPINGKCECAQVLKKINDINYVCNINNRTISRPANTQQHVHWIGQLTLNSKKFGFSISLDCPNRYCEINPVFDSYLTGHNSNDLIYLITSAEPSLKPVPQCLFNRSGTLCGECTGNLSVVFGSNKCMKCPKYQWIWVTVLKIVIGPLFIYLLYKLQLTMTIGTLNGIIFYAQAANAGMLDLLHLCTASCTGLNYVVQISIFFLSTLNLNVGFPLCFYNGMTELWKAGLNLLFPVYLLVIVIVIIIVSRYSIRVSNRISHSSVQVLMTVLHLSFSKLLLAIMDVLTSTYIYTETSSYKVWYWNGNVEFGKGAHLILMSVILAIALPLLLPYVFILIFSRFFHRFSFINRYLRPAIESIHGPYKQGQQYWFVARLILLVIMYSIYMRYRGVEVIRIFVATAPLLLTFVIVQSLAKPFKNQFINILDLWVMYTLLFLYTTTWYFLVKLQLNEASIVVTVNVFLIIGTAILILLYHILLAFGLVDTLNRKLTSVLIKISIKVRNTAQYFFTSSQRNDVCHEGTGSYYGACDAYREPLLSLND